MAVVFACGLARNDLELTIIRRVRVGMTDRSITLFPGMIKPLRLARAYGFLVQRGDSLYHPGGSQQVCSIALARNMVDGGWLEEHGQRYEPTAQALLDRSGTNRRTALGLFVPIPQPGTNNLEATGRGYASDAGSA